MYIFVVLIESTDGTHIIRISPFKMLAKQIEFYFFFDFGELQKLIPLTRTVHSKVVSKNASEIYKLRGDYRSRSVTLK